MPREVEDALFYFPLDCDFFTNPKIKALRREHGTVGIATYLYILCDIYSHGYYVKMHNRKQYERDIAENIANDQLAKVAARVHESIDYMADNADYPLLDRSCLDQGILTSRAVQEQYIKTIALRRRKSQIKEYNLLTPFDTAAQKPVNAEEIAINAEEIAINATFIPRKGKGNKSISLTRDKEPPTLADIESYCKERKNKIDPQRFFDYYSANGWSIGGSPMRDWQAAVRRWETNSIGNNRTIADADEGHVIYERQSASALNAMFTKIGDD